MTRLAVYKIFNYLVIVAGIFLSYRGIARLTGADLVVASLICGLFFVVYMLPFVVFGAGIEITEHGVHVR
ncbi:MAG TPA: hypothetical protein VKW06_18995 [Candidatus Angelobacter sp.]|nr:hypothetical protein [Candidatus Angelobacter sp.]